MRTMTKWVLEVFFSRFRWARRLLGGKWELWYVDHPVCADVWHPVNHWSTDELIYPKNGGLPWFDRPTPLCRGGCVREEW